MLDRLLEVLLSGVQGGGETYMKQKEQERQAAIDEKKRGEAFQTDILKSVIGNLYRPKSPFDLTGPIDLTNPQATLDKIRKVPPKASGPKPSPFGGQPKLTLTPQPTAKKKLSF